MLVLPPGRLSTAIGWPSRSDTTPPSSRAVVSVPPPGENGTMIVTGWLGQFACADAASGINAAAAASAAAFR